MKRNYHCCATCRHFRVRKQPGEKTGYMCSRLGYATEPVYRFDCWTPNDVVKKRIQNET